MNISAVELRKFDVKELQKELNKLVALKFKLRLQLSTEEMTKVHQLSLVKKSIARALTVLREKAKKVGK